MKLAKDKFSLPIDLNLTTASPTAAISATYGVVDEFNAGGIGKDGAEGAGEIDGVGMGGADGAKLSLTELVMDNDFIIELTSVPSG